MIDNLLFFELDADALQVAHLLGVVENDLVRMHLERHFSLQTIGAPFGARVPSGTWR